MQSESRIALPYLSATTGRAAIRSPNRRPRVASYLRTIIPDVLVAWDVAAFFFSGLAIADAPARFAIGSGQSHHDLILTAGLGALLAPVVIRARQPGRLTLATVKSVVLRAVTLVALIITLARVTGEENTAPSFCVAGWLAAVVMLLLGGRVLAAGALQAAAHWFGGERVGIIGLGHEAEWLRTTLGRAKPTGLELVASGRRGGSLNGVLNDLLEQGRQGTLDRVILAQPGLSNDKVRQIAHRLKALQIEVASLFPLVGADSLRPGAEIAEIPLFVVSRRPQWGYGGLAKLLLDRCLALMLLLWMTPLLLIIAAAVYVDSPGPILFRQRRHGVNGGEFEIYKFRTMVWQGRNAGDGAVQTGRNDRRVTRIGAILRQSSLDEVPQLLNVLNGTMSLVGPRPHPTVMRTEDRSGDEITAEYPHRHRVKPGITGWAQINGLRGATETADQLRRRIEHDNYYIENWSPWFDLRILAMTPVSLLIRRTNAF